MKTYIKGTDNLLPYPYYSGTTTANGATLTDNGNGSITASGTPTGYVEMILVRKFKVTTDLTVSLYGSGTNITVSISLFKSDGSLLTSKNAFLNKPFTLIKDNYEGLDYIQIGIKRSNNNVEITGVYYPMLNKGTVALPYAKYAPTKRVKFLYGSRNLIPFPYTKKEGTSEGVTYSYSNDGGVILNGTTTGNRFDWTIRLGALPVGTYTYTIYANDYTLLLGYVSIQTSTGGYVKNLGASSKGNGFTFTIAEDTLTEGNQIAINICAYGTNGSSVTFDNRIVYPMLNKGSTALPYDKYFPLSYMDVYFKSKNLIDITAINWSDGVIERNPANSSVVINTYNAWCKSAKPISYYAPQLKVGETYNVSFNTTSPNNFIYLSGSKTIWRNGTSHILTQAEYDSGFSIYGNTDETHTISNFMLNEGSNALSHEPPQPYPN